MAPSPKQTQDPSIQAPAPGELTPELARVVASQSERWRHCDSSPFAGLLRLSILRELMRELHAQKSRSLAAGQREGARALKIWENRLTELRSHPKLEGDLSDLVCGRGDARKRTRLLPEALYSAIPRDKLDRYDRQWETAIAAEACSMGWRFWSLEAWIEITLAEEWNRRLQDQLWPSALVLFAESAESSSASGSRKAQPPSTAVAPLGAASAEGGPLTPETALWRGRWILVAEPRFRTPAEIAGSAALNLAQWPGSPPEPPSPAAWKLLFSPKTR
jgi:hypothetical protein